MKKIILNSNVQFNLVIDDRNSNSTYSLTAFNSYPYASNFGGNDATS